MPTIVLYSDLRQDNLQYLQPSTSPFVTNVDSIYQSIENIINTSIGTRLFNPLFGSLVNSILFDPVDSSSESSLYDAVIQAIQIWEPRVTVNYALTNITADPANNAYDVVITFIIKGLDYLGNFEYTGSLTQPIPTPNQQ